MCPPTYYGIEYEINPWMSRDRQVDRDEAQKQWEALRAAIESAGAAVSVIDPVAGLPDMVFTANAAMIYQRHAIISRFRHPQRQGEEEYDAAWLRAHGFAVTRLPAEMFFEGAGDALFCGDTLLAGYHLRSHAASMQFVGELIARRVIPLELVDDYYYHLDTCFCPVRPGVALYFPGAFDDYGRQALAAAVDELIEVQEDEARSFACNAVVIGDTVITNQGCPQMQEELQRRGFKTVATPLHEFVKAGGSAKCLTLRLDGEDAASWRPE